MPFKDVIEQGDQGEGGAHAGLRRLVGLLARSVHREVLPPSLILSGPAGAGKRAMAVATAQALNCLAPRGEGESRDACGTCTACARIGRGAHPDVIVVEPEESGSIKIEQVRAVIDSAGYRPFEGRRRVVIIDGADAMAASPQNALLKVLEEPPPSSVFILITTRPDMLLPTVRSRCQHLRFHLSGQGAIDAEARDVAWRVLEAAAGSAEPRQRIEAAKDLLKGTGGGNSAAEDRAQLGSHLHAMASLLRDIELLSARASVALANRDLQPELDRLSKAYRSQRAMTAYGAVDRALAALDSNASIKIVADWLVLQL